VFATKWESNCILNIFILAALCRKCIRTK